MAVHDTTRLAAGDPEAFAALYDRLAARLLATVRSLGGSRAEAEDVVQDLFVDLARFRSGLAGVADIDAYVFTMLRHALSRRRRRGAVARRVLGAIAQERGAGSVPPAAHADDELAAAVARLPVPQREVLALKIDGGLTFSEIATVLGTSLNTAASRYRYAIDKLRTALGHRLAEVRR